LRWADSLALLHEYGPGWVIRRSAWEVALRGGLMARRLPARPAPGEPERDAAAWMPDGSPEVLHAAVLQGAERFFLPDGLDTLRERVADPRSVLARADDLLDGRMTLFAHRTWAVGHPPDWFRSPFTNVVWPDTGHWSSIDELSPERGDIKPIWEIARFGQAFLLARAFAVTGDAKYPETFFAQAEDWIATNPPETGPHWRCGQEASLRLLAWSFGLFAFARTAAAAPARVARLVESIHDHAHHIAAVHGYAVHCLRNNHAISEATALFTAGQVFPFFPESPRWRRAGLDSLVRETWQVYGDGAYVQHSPNYARMVAQLYTWTLALCGACGVSPPAELIRAARRLLRFLVGLQDRASGALPNYGANDGTLILPLSSCDYSDFRPALNALGALLGEGPLYGPGPWEEEAAWLAGRQGSAKAAVPGTPAAPGAPAVAAADRAPRLGDGGSAPAAFPEGGYYRLDGLNTHGVMRCGVYQHRPHQADMLHLDLWFHGCNVCADAGTYAYNAEPRWAGYFTGTACHNTVTVNDLDQMRRGERFLWHDWVAGHLLEHRVTPQGMVLRGRHDGYHPVDHTRSVAVHDGIWLVIDDLGGAVRDSEMRLHWLVPLETIATDERGAVIELPEPGWVPAATRSASRVALRLECGATGNPEGNWVRGNEQIPRGWHAPYYGEREPAWSYELVVMGRHARFVTLIGPQEAVERLLPLTLDKARELAEAWGLESR
jgi:hypothetical protein